MSTLAERAAEIYLVLRGEDDERDVVRPSIDVLRQAIEIAESERVEPLPGPLTVRIYSQHGNIAYEGVDRLEFSSSSFPGRVYTFDRHLALRWSE